jgi:hypothetical protein
MTIHTFETLVSEQLATVAGGVKCDLSGLPSAAQSIIQRESGGESTAKNPHSTAFGVGQLLIANRRTLMGANANSTSCSAQIDAFSKYTKGRYGSFEKALSFHKSHGWY